MPPLSMYFAGTARWKRRGYAISAFRIGCHTLVEQDSIAAFQRDAQQPFRFDAEELKIDA